MSSQEWALNLLINKIMNDADDDDDAIANGIQFVKTLLKHGADPNEICGNYKSKNEEYVSPLGQLKLMYWCKEKQPIFKLLKQVLKKSGAKIVEHP